MTNPDDVRLDEPRTTWTVTDEDMALLTKLRETQAVLPPELVALMRVFTPAGRYQPLANVTDQELLKLFVELREERARAEADDEYGGLPGIFQVTPRSPA